MKAIYFKLLLRLFLITFKEFKFERRSPRYHRKKTILLRENALENLFSFSHFQELLVEDGEKDEKRKH